MSDSLVDRSSNKFRSGDPTRRSVIAGMATTAAAASAPSIIGIAPAAAAPNVLDQVKQYVDILTTGQFPIPPWEGALDGHVPNMTGLPRDDDNIICQPEANDNPSDGTFRPMHTSHGFMDGGDSAARTGVAAFCNSAQDIDLLPKFEKNGMMICCGTPRQGRPRQGPGACRASETAFSDRPSTQ
jgi:hypothetical protein